MSWKTSIQDMTRSFLCLQSHELTVHFSINYQYAEGNELSEHPESALRSIQQRWIELCNVEEHH